MSTPKPITGKGNGQETTKDFLVEQEMVLPWTLKEKGDIWKRSEL